MASGNKKIAIIGGGICGIFAIAEARKEDMNLVCFEKTDNYGGTWCYRDESIEGIASIMPSTVTNHSKEMCGFSNFPPKKEYSVFMKHHECYQYITEYVKLNECEKYIKYNCEVVSVQKDESYEKTGKWKVTVKNTQRGNIFTDVYDGVIVATGHFAYPKKTHFPNQDNYLGKIMHTHGLKEVAEFKNQTVVVVGTGCSALDAAVEVSNVAKQVYLSTRSGAHIACRLGPNGVPIDYVLFRRYLLKLIDLISINLCNLYLQTFYLDQKFDHRLYAIQPKYGVLSKDPILNDFIGAKLLSGSVIQKPDIKCFEENGVVFSGENEVTEVDAIIMATGYDFKFPFLEEGVFVREKGQINLYKCVFPSHLSHPTLAFIGFINPFGPGSPLVELQARWIAWIFAGKGTLPSEETMLENAKERFKKNQERYAPSDITGVRVDYVQYLDEISQEIGAKPNLYKLFFTDIRLFLRLVFGPCLAYQYRLEGPHKWDGAREAIMTVDERLFWPIRKNEKERKSFRHLFWEYVLNLIPTNPFLTKF